MQDTAHHVISDAAYQVLQFTARWSLVHSFSSQTVHSSLGQTVHRLEAHKKQITISEGQKVHSITGQRVPGLLGQTVHSCWVRPNTCYRVSRSIRIWNNYYCTTIQIIYWLFV
jgi:hypothetical protein